MSVLLQRNWWKWETSHPYSDMCHRAGDLVLSPTAGVHEERWKERIGCKHVYLRLLKCHFQSSL